jgi:uncharacterized protein (TIGR00369 family)
MSHAYLDFVARMGASFGALWTTRWLPASELLGLHVRKFNEDLGEAVVSFVAKDDFCNAMGVVQGGFLTAMLDDAMGIAGTAATGMTQLMLTHELKTSFIRAGEPGILVAHARCAHVGRSIAFLEARLVSANGQLIATGSATARPVGSSV